jgi:hypothetical protein
MKAWRVPRTTADGAGSGVGLRLGAAEDFAYLATGVLEGAGDLADRHPVAVRQTNLGVIVRRQQPCLRSRGPVGDGGLGERRQLRWISFAGLSWARGWRPVCPAVTKVASWGRP